MTIGIDLATYATELSHVAPEHDQKPVRSFDVASLLGDRVYDYLDAFFQSRDLEKVGNGLPARGFAGLNLDQAAKTIASFDHEQEAPLIDEMHAEPALHLLHKIRLSAWGWSHEKIGWNETVDAYDGIRSFDLGIDGLTTTLDHTVWRHKQGKSEHARMFLDGVFGFLIHHRGEHVMTIGFSIASKRRLLVQQVQLTSRTGNRWLFKLPGNRMELILDRMRAAFPAHTIMVADGASVADRMLEQYRKALTDVEIATDEARAVALEAKITHLEADRPRLVRFYGDLGRFRRSRRTYESGGLVHHAIAA